MLRKLLIVIVVAGLTALVTPAKAHAWGAAHVGYTHVGPSGVYHYGRTAAVGPYGAYSGAHAGAYGYGGSSYHAGGAYGYHGDSYGGYHYDSGYHYGGGYHYGSMSYGREGYEAGVYRRW
jgi:hypothetical protein